MAAVAEALTRARARARPTWAALKRAPTIPLFIMGVMILAAVFADALPLQSPYEVRLPNKLTPPYLSPTLKPPFLTPSAGAIPGHPLGTDALGRDTLSRLIYGARMSLIVAFVALALAGVIGSALGIIAGYYGGAVDAVISRIVDASFAFPMILLALLLAVALGPSFRNVIMVLALVLWARYARQSRGEALAVKQQDFVAYARVAGANSWHIMLKHLFPNILNTIVVLLTLQVGWAIIVEASLSFLGAGIPPPTPAWGGMVSDGRQYIATAWWLSLIPGIAIVLLCLSMNLLGDWLRETLDPKQRQV